MTTSPSDTCEPCKGTGTRFSIHTQPVSAGLPEQRELDRQCVALSYADGSTGVVRWWDCPTCNGSGRRPRFGPDDVRAMVQWSNRFRIRLSPITRPSHRGIVVKERAAHESSEIAGELWDRSSTGSPLKASTTLRVG